MISAADVRKITETRSTKSVMLDDVECGIKVVADRGDSYYNHPFSFLGVGKEIVDYILAELKCAGFEATYDELTGTIHIEW